MKIFLTVGLILAFANTVFATPEDYIFRINTGKYEKRLEIDKILASADRDCISKFEDNFRTRRFREQDADVSSIEVVNRTNEDISLVDITLHFSKKNKEGEFTKYLGYFRQACMPPPQVEASHSGSGSSS